ncbi:MAG: NUDIX domain-containing protein [Candidatus Paceibacterota bacterium]
MEWLCGKKEEGESIEEAAIREIQEEGNVIVQKEDSNSLVK